MMLDSDGPRSGGGGAGAGGGFDNPSRWRTRSTTFSAVSRVVRRCLRSATCCRSRCSRRRAGRCSRGLMPAVLPVPELVGRRGAPAVARHLPIAGAPFGLDLGGELGVAGLVVAFIGGEAGEVLLAAALATGRPAGRRTGGAGEGIAGRGVITDGCPQGVLGGSIVTEGRLERLAGPALAGLLAERGCALPARGAALGLAYRRLGAAQLVADLVALRADLRFEALK